MRLSSVAFIVAMLTGAAVYDPELVNRALAWLGSDWTVEKETVIRFPVYLTLATALCAVVVTTLMKEPPLETECGGESSMWSGILAAGGWIVKTPLVAGVILTALVHDSVARVFLTTASEYYRLIGIPVVWFGVIGAGFAALGIFTPKLAEWLVAHRTMRTNYLFVSLLIFIGLIGISLAIPHWGVAVVVFFSAGFGLLNFFTSHYLNAQVDSRRRATVLSFKGLALNLGFGAISLVYGGILRFIKDGDTSSAAADPAFRESLYWLPGIFLALYAGLFLYYRLRVSPAMARDRP